MPAWKQVHAQIFQMSPKIAPREKMKVLGNAPGQWPSPTASLQLDSKKRYTEDMIASYRVGQTWVILLYTIDHVYFYI